MITFLIFFLGLFIGSFLNVLIDRLPRDKSILGRSHCEFCKHILSTKDLIPLLSFVYLKGKCRFCKAELSYQYPFIEIFTGAMFALTSYFVLQDSIFNLDILVNLIFVLFVVSGLIVLFFADIKYYLIPNKITTWLGIATAAYLLFNPSLIISHLISAILVFIFFLLVYLITKGKGWGFGDVKFAFVMGLMLGPIGTITALYVAFLTGASVGIILILWRKKGLKSIIPFAPFLVIGTYIGLLFSNQIISLLPRFGIIIPAFL